MTDVAAPAAAPTTGTDTSNGAPAVAAPETPPNPLTWDAESKSWVHVGKVDGQEKRFAFDELTKKAQLAEAAQKRFEEAKAIKRENAQLVERQRMLADALINPERAMQAWQEAGLDPRQMLAYMQKHLDAEAALTPEQRELRDLRAKEAERQKQYAQQQEQQRLQQEAEAENAEHARVEGVFHKQLDKLNVPPSSEMRGHMVTLMWALADAAQEAGESLKASEAAKQAHECMRTMARDIIVSMSPAERAQLLGADIVTSIATTSVASAAPIPKAVPRHDVRAPDGRYAPAAFTPFRSGSNRSFSNIVGRQR